MFGAKRFGFFASVFVGLITACSIPSSGKASDASPPPARTRSDGVVCSSVALSKRPLEYCYQDRANQASKAEPNVVYFFHGLGGNEEQIFDGTYSFILDAIADIFGADMPIIVGVSLGSTGVMGYEASEVVSNGLARIEKNFASGKSVRRLVLGASMGGHNALRLVGQRSSSFVGVAGLCPAMATFNGHDAAAVAAYKKRHVVNLDLPFFNRALAIYKRELPTTKAWSDNDPFSLLPRGAYDRLPVFLSVGTEDSLGFYEGVRAFAAQSALRPAMTVEASEIEGSHCSFDVDALLVFMVRSFQTHVRQAEALR